MRASTRRISRRHFLAGTLVASTAAGFLLANAPSAQAQKVSKAAANYQNQPSGGRRCAGCRYFQSPNACQRVQGTISADGWCALWAASAGGRSYSY
jgi:hypothetical protein